ncbi:MAG: hypothetical protein KDD10_05230 [Phaeodactylibacter sp.]|nr:hypothetical protein [Phaeodactylibacter sp.]MCB9293800.1 hypothetical protein [Lewinellaceae bacterium]
MKKLLLILTFAVFSIFGCKKDDIPNNFGDPSECSFVYETFSTKIGGPGKTGHSILQKCGTHYLIVGHSNAIGRQVPFFTRVDHTGAQRVYQEYPQFEDAAEYSKILPFEENRYFIYGSANTSAGLSGYILTVDSEGNTLSSKTINYRNEATMLKAGIIHSSGNRVFVGWGRNTNIDLMPLGAYLLILDKSGNTIFEEVLTEDGEKGVDIIEDQNGDLVILTGFGGGYSKLIKTAKDGSTIWKKKLSLAGNIAQANDNGYIISGIKVAPGGGGLEIGVNKVDVNGEVEWERTYSKSGSEKIGANLVMIKTRKGDFVLATFAFNHEQEPAYLHGYVLKIDDTGAIAWDKYYDMDNDFYEVPISLVETSDGGLAFTGTATYDLDADGEIFISKTDSAGDF